MDERKNVAAKKIPVVAISGVKNSGKTTLIEKLLPIFCAKGLKAAVIKHDGHTFEPDVEGTDSSRMRKAGAYGTAVFCDTHYMIVKNEPTTNRELQTYFPQADLILCEGLKNSGYSKIEVVRKGISDQPVCDPKTLLAIAADFVLNSPIPTVSLNHPEQIAQIICNYVREEQAK